LQQFRDLLGQPANLAASLPGMNPLQNVGQSLPGALSSVNPQQLLPGTLSSLNPQQLLPGNLPFMNPLLSMGQVLPGFLPLHGQQGFGMLPPWYLSGLMSPGYGQPGFTYTPQVAMGSSLSPITPPARNTQDGGYEQPADAGQIPPVPPLVIPPAPAA